MKITLFLFLGFFCATLFAEIYQSVDSHGVVTYSDQPKTDSTAIALPAANISTVPATTTTTIKNSTSTTDETEARKPYVSFDLASPKDQEVFQNPTEISMSVYIQPELQPGDTIQFFFDNKAIDKASTSTIAVLQKTSGETINLDRGTHTIHAVLYDSKNKVIEKTQTTTVFVHYASVNFPKQPFASPGLQ